MLKMVIKKSLKYHVKKKLFENYVTPFLNKRSNFDSICSFSWGLINAMKEASKFFLSLILLGALQITDQLNE